jgi:glycosyltransferase involved in cell wall biosynthesis
MKKRLEITIPVYNEENELENSILKLYKYCLENLEAYDWQITIADNASSDNTPIIGANLSKKHKEISLFRLEEKGRGRAVKRAWSNSEADFCAYMDLDLSTDLKHLPKLLEVLNNGYDIAIGSRLAKGARVEGRTLLREITSRTLNFFFIKFWFHTHFTDAQCGFKAVTKEVVENLIPYIKDNDWFFDGELLIVGEKAGYKVYEEPVHWVDNPGSTVRLVSTIFGDIEVMIRLLRTRPWKHIHGRT